jgi:hypothetical protein
MRGTVLSEGKSCWDAPFLTGPAVFEGEISSDVAKGQVMRVLFIIHELALNGAVTALLAQTRALIGAGEQVSVLIPPLHGPAAALQEMFLAAGARLVSFCR